jgi:hypothetical protein
MDCVETDTIKTAATMDNAVQFSDLTTFLHVKKIKFTHFVGFLLNSEIFSLRNKYLVKSNDVTASPL